METGIPFCRECGFIGARLSGLHPDDIGLVRWTLYGCGHMTTEIVLETTSTVDQPWISAEVGTV